MKKALKKLGAAILAMAMIASLTPVTGLTVLADETETEAPAAEETESSKKETEKPKADEPEETEAPKETEAVKETEETEAPKETEEPKEEAPDETEAPKETESTEPQETDKPEADTPKEPSSAASNPGKNDSVGTITNIKVSASGKMTWDMYPYSSTYKANISGYANDIDTFNRELAVNTEIDSLIRSGELKKSSSYTIVISAYDSNNTLLAKGSYVYEYNSTAEPVQTGQLKASISGGILTWEAYEGAYEYNLTINSHLIDLEDGQFSFDLNKTIDKLIRAREIGKNDTYEIHMNAFTANGKAEWNTTYTYSSSATPVVVGTINNPVVANKVLSWDAYSGAAEYLVGIKLIDGTAFFSRVKTNSFEIDKHIDEAIEAGCFDKHSPYQLVIVAYDADNIEIAKGETEYAYNSSAEPIPPKPMGTITAAISTDGILSWDPFEGAESYDVIIAGYRYWMNGNANSLDLKTTIDKLIKRGDITKTDSYKITMTAQSTYGAKIAEWSGAEFTYASPFSYISVGDISASISNGILTWQAYKGAAYYNVFLSNASSETKFQPASIELNKWIDRLIKEGNLEKNDFYPIEIEAVDEDGITLATWSQKYEYTSGASVIVVGTISNAVIANGALSWDAYPNATSYAVYVSSDGSSRFGEIITETSYSLSDLNKRIDSNIKRKFMKKADSYFISIEALDEDGLVIAEGALSEKYAYNSPAEPIDVGTVKASIADGVLTWEAYANADFYAVLINNSWSTQKQYVQASSVKLNELVYSSIASGYLSETDVYSVQLYAYDKDGFTIANWSGTFNYVRSANPMTVSPRTYKLKYKKIKKKAKAVARSKVLTIKNAKGILTFKKLSGNKKILINAKNGVVTVKKKLKKGTYKVKVQVTSSGDANYTKKIKTVTFKIKIK